MPTFHGYNHLSLSVTDLDRSQKFYVEVLDFMLLMPADGVRILFHRGSGTQLGLIRHEDGEHAPFSELNTGLDHLGFTAGSREELEEWARRFDELGVPYTPIRDMPFGHHLNFRDPDNIPLELHVPNDVARQGYERLQREDVPREEIDAYLQQVLGTSS